MNTRTKTATLIASAAAAVALLAGCANDGTGPEHTTEHRAAGTSTSMSATTPADAASAHNAADMMWVQMMIPHHQQAVEMAEMVSDHSTNPELVALASRIEAAQGPEIAQMTGWLEDWNAPATDATMDHSMPGTDASMPGMDHGGMMTAEQMTQLDESTGAAFDQAWLEMMIEHHVGAVDSSEEILASGQSAQVKELAQSIIDGQQAEIDQMKAMLGR
ncbi:DUF305 domain-containing protein [Rhodococcus tukisamuensis]|uniref:Uncharacterized conserved protein, DUF305 family n=1 Tax=Rhodococcus tukisamuensis TaxID=168276 RepID=A0A1G7CJE4_9NOCA|nr:DUF305 domain-containing protein [Rhodococcus tukisamuensis]SDE39439.1 Uncharacterized conserved protein, DUF305 family [Rhodococcus tukisamuensis]